VRCSPSAAAEIKNSCNCTHTKKSALNTRPRSPRVCQPLTANQMACPHTTSSTMPSSLFSTSASLRASASHSFAHSSTSAAIVSPASGTTFRYRYRSSTSNWGRRESCESFGWSRSRRRKANVGRFSARTGGCESIDVNPERMPGPVSLEKNEGGTSSGWSARWTAVIAKPTKIQYSYGPRKLADLPQLDPGCQTRIRNQYE
jgi:hypothetical protein